MLLPSSRRTWSKELFGTPGTACPPLQPAARVTSANEYKATWIRLSITFTPISILGPMFALHPRSAGRDRFASALLSDQVIFRYLFFSYSYAERLMLAA